MRRMFLLLPMVLITGCLSVLPEPEAPGGLYSISSARANLGLAQNIVIREFDAPEIMAGRGVVSESPTGALRFVRSVEWSGRLTRLLQLALIDSFTGAGPGVALSPESGVAAPYVASGRIHRLVLKGDVAVCKASVVLTEPARRRLIAQFETEVEQQVNGTSAEQRALSLRAAAGTCVADLASAVSETLDRVAQETSPD